MRKIKVLLTVLGFMSGSALLFSFATPKNVDHTEKEKQGVKGKFSGTLFSVTSVSSNTGTTITFIGADITGKVEGMDYHCTSPAATCTVAITGSSTVTDNGGGSFTVTNPSMNNLRTYTPGH